ncbi:MAG TPA: hypothetical protein VMT46_06055 [Anaerolineaceae bacterium]|nr:hypothetical protein [Anaerolineaceae bacterium]
MSSRNPPQITFSMRSVLLLLIIQVIVVFALAWPTIHPQVQSASSTEPAGFAPTATDLPSPTPTITLTETEVAPAPQEPTQAPIALGPISEGWMVLSLNDNGFAHLFAYQPQTLPLTRLTDNPWDDQTPAISPDGSRIAYSSRRNGYWDLYILDLTSGQTVQVTDTPEYDGAPSWSPDGTWLAYETYVENNLEIYLLSITDRSQPPIRLTQDKAADFSPAWAPGVGRKIAFVSNRSGDNEIWMADLDNVDERFVDISRSPQSSEDHPIWSPDGSSLAWVSSVSGQSSIMRWDPTHPNQLAARVGSGDWAAWSPSGSWFVAHVPDPYTSYLTAYPVNGDTLLLPPVTLPGAIHGLDWKGGTFPTDLPSPLAQAARAVSTPVFKTILTPPQDGPANRRSVVSLEDVSAPYPYLQDSVDEAFRALRRRVASELGWDFLASLENAYVPLTAPLSPGMGNDWLYTGRAFAFNPSPMSAGWIILVREDHGGQTYWRVYIKTRFQDGSQGKPVSQLSWDLNARSSGNTLAYEQGGLLASSAPAGYWLDFTDLASRFGWQRQPALVNWRTFYPGTLYNEFYVPDGLDWQSAILEIYPREIMITPTPIQTSTSTPTRIPTWYRTRVPTNTVTPSVTPTRRPTWTPIPSGSAP